MLLGSSNTTRSAGTTAIAADASQSLALPERRGGPNLRELHGARPRADASSHTDVLRMYRWYGVRSRRLSLVTRGSLLIRQTPVADLATSATDARYAPESLRRVGRRRRRRPPANSGRHGDGSGW